jgi:hypothetical protein
MGTEFFTEDTWLRLKTIVRKESSRARIAVAYFGKGASKLLPLQNGSKLVVDASGNAVKTGQTCPSDLLALHIRGARIFSVPNLHAKVYVFSRTAFIGSANASTHSEVHLIEAVLKTTDSETVKKCRSFVENLAKAELGPQQLKKLQAIYRPPRFLNDTSRPRQQRRRASLETIRVVHLSPVTWSEREEVEHEAGSKKARRLREHRSLWRVESFRWSGSNPPKKNDQVAMITREASGKQLVDPPGSVLHVRRYNHAGRTRYFVYVELSERRRRTIQSIARTIGRGALKRLQRSGTLRRDMSDKLRDLWLR